MNWGYFLQIISNGCCRNSCHNKGLLDIRCGRTLPSNDIKLIEVLDINLYYHKIIHFVNTVGNWILTFLFRYVINRWYLKSSGIHRIWHLSLIYYYRFFWLQEGSVPENAPPHSTSKKKMSINVLTESCFNCDMQTNWKDRP